MPTRILICLFAASALIEGTLIAAEVDFDRDIAPLLSKRCLGCHAGDDSEAALDLSQKSTAFAGGENGIAITPGDVEQSLLWRRVAAGEMPEDEPLSESEKKLLKAWIAGGAEWGSGPIDVFAYSSDSRAGYDWWSLQSLAETPLPTVSDESWPRNAIDYFVLARLEDADLQPSADASPSLLVRRLYFDVIGLPPTVSDADALSADPAVYPELVDQLLSTVQFGQHWARHWLDVVRFGESHGFEYNQPRNNAWWYRNWVIDALNDDMPYDEFVRRQVAADVMHPNDSSAWAATGFLVAGPHNTTKPSSDNMRKTMRHDELEDIVGTIGQTFLGLTINCARCHDHKFDPITQREYYEMVATVVGIDHGERDLPDAAADKAKRDLSKLHEQLNPAREKLKQLKQQSDASPEASPEFESLRKQVEQLAADEKRLKSIRGPARYMAISRQPPSVTRLKRGDVTTPAEVVAPSGVRAVNGDLARFNLNSDSGDAPRRMQLAAWLTRNQNPLLARVIVNRLWHYHFGSGLVRTPSDFGFNGDRPSHPELLDYLAVQLIKNDWKLKPIHRLILNSATYRQSSRLRDDASAVDAENRLLWRMNPRRQTAEQMRDSVLSVAGKLDVRHGGPGYRDVREYKYKGSHYYDPLEPSAEVPMRRTVYRFSPRGAKRTILDTFDCPDPSARGLSGKLPRHLFNRFR